jgi:hypothetical protein
MIKADFSLPPPLFACSEQLFPCERTPCNAQKGRENRKDALWRNSSTRPSHSAAIEIRLNGQPGASVYLAAGERNTLLKPHQKCIRTEWQPAESLQRFSNCYTPKAHRRVAFS